MINFSYLRHFLLFFVVIVRGHKFCLFELHNCCGMCKWSSSNDGEVVHIRLTMVTLYWIAFLPPRKSYRIGIRLTHVNGDFDAISVTEQNCAAPISKVESHLSHRCSYFTGEVFVSAYFWLLSGLPSFNVLFSNPIKIK